MVNQRAGMYAGAKHEMRENVMTGKNDADHDEVEAAIQTELGDDPIAEPLIAVARGLKAAGLRSRNAGTPEWQRADES